MSLCIVLVCAAAGFLMSFSLTIHPHGLSPNQLHSSAITDSSTVGTENISTDRSLQLRVGAVKNLISSGQQASAQDRETNSMPQKHIDPNSDEWDNSVAVCAIMKNEKLSDILEWLLYHRWMGVDKVFLRENRYTMGPPSPDIQQALQHLIDEGFLNFGTWAGQSPQAQQLWYNRCAQEDLAGAQAWILFSDLDEYPVLLNGMVAVENPDIKDYMKLNRGAAGVTLQWVLFGTSGFHDRPQPGGPLRHFHKCSDELSFEMKCFAASHYLSEQPFIGPNILHACCYQYNPDEDPKNWPAVLYGDGVRAADDVIQQMSFSVKSNATNFQHTTEQRACRSYRGHLEPQEYDNNRSIPQGYTLVLFHYMTRSFQDFRERKLSRYAGWYVDAFRQRRNAAWSTRPNVTDAELLEDLENDLGINRDAPVCSSAVQAQYAAKCCN